MRDATAFRGNRRERRRWQAARLRGERGRRPYDGRLSFRSTPMKLRWIFVELYEQLQFTGLDGGTCLFRAGVGYIVLRLLGWSPLTLCWWCTLSRWTFRDAVMC